VYQIEPGSWSDVRQKGYTIEEVENARAATAATAEMDEGTFTVGLCSSYVFLYLTHYFQI
jgi:hypothetical protein